MRIVLAAAILGALATAASAQDRARFPYPYAADGTINHHSRPAVSPADDFQCHKNHAGLALASAESAAQVEARLNEALAGGGALIVAEIDDIDCAFCAAAVERAFASRPGVAAAAVNVREATISIVMRPDAAIADASIRKIVKHRGYEVAGIARVRPPLVAEN